MNISNTSNANTETEKFRKDGVTMADAQHIIKLQEPQSEEREALVLELQRLLACYQMASPDDKNVVWAALNKYAPLINEI